MNDLRTIRSGDIYRHFKNQFVVVDGTAIHTETEQELIIYHHIDSDYVRSWARPISMWFDEKIDSAGNKVPRFTRLCCYDHITLPATEKRESISRGDYFRRWTDGKVICVDNIYFLGDEYFVTYTDGYNDLKILEVNKMFEPITDTNGNTGPAFVKSIT